MIWTQISLNVLGSTYMLTRVSANVIHLGEDAHRRANPGADGWSSGLFSPKGLNNKPAGGLKRFVSDTFVYIQYMYTVYIYFLVLLSIKAGLLQQFLQFQKLFKHQKPEGLQVHGEDGSGFSKIDEQEKKWTKWWRKSAWRLKSLFTAF